MTSGHDLSHSQQPTVDELLLRIDELESRLKEKETFEKELIKSRGRETHIRQVMTATRNINRLISRETGLLNLIQGACDNLTMTMGYYTAWIAVLDRYDPTHVRYCAASGFNGGFEIMKKNLESGTYPRCMQDVLGRKGFRVIDDPGSFCPECSLSELSRNSTRFSIRLEYNGKCLGVLAVSLPSEFANDSESRLLFMEASAELAYAIYKLEEDITESDRTGKALKNSMDLINRIVEQIPGVVYQFVLQPDGKSFFPFISQGIRDIYGLSPEGLREDASPMYNRIHPDDYDLIMSMLMKSSEDLSHFHVEYRVINPQKGVLWCLCDAKPTRLEDGGTLWHGIITDITARIKVEEQLKYHKTLLEDVGRIAAIGGWEFDPSTGEGTWTAEVARIHDLDPGDPTSMEKGISFYREEDRKKIQAAIERAVTQGLPYELELKLVTEKGAKKMVRTIGHPVVVNGVVTQIRGSFQDITEQFNLKEQLLQAQKMDSIGRLAGGVAHDFNNMLSVILGHAELAMELLEPSQDLYKDLEEIRKAAERSADLTRQLLAFARKQTIAPRRFDVNEGISGMLTMLRRLIGENISLAWKPGSQIWPVLIDPSQMDQILANLCVNARDAVADLGRITIESTNISVDDSSFLSRGRYIPDDFITGDYVQISVSDNGKGMARETIDHLFEPFFTTKNTGEGTGLGLATVYGIVKQNKGFIDVYSELNTGTVFKIYLPRYTGAVVETKKNNFRIQDLKGSETILLVEDEKAILMMGQLLLERQGYRVLTANTPSSALTLAENHRGDIHLLITDVVMPGMTGRDLSASLSIHYKNMKTLFMSGYTANVIAHHGVLDEGVHFIEKPFSKNNFCMKLRQVLDAG